MFKKRLKSLCVDFMVRRLMLILDEQRGWKKERWLLVYGSRLRR
jgi:hypothetical protein